MPFKTNLNFVNPHTQHNPADFAVDNKLKQQVGNHYSEKFVASPKKKAGFFAGIANFFGRIGKSSQNAGSTKQVRQANTKSDQNQTHEPFHLFHLLVHIYLNSIPAQRPHPQPHATY